MRKSSQNAGCGQIGCVGLLILFAVIGKCGATGPSFSSDTSSSSSTYNSDNPPRTSSYSGDAVTMYSHGSMAVRTAPSRDASLVRTLGRGDEIRIGAKDAHGWAPVLSPYGEVEGYVYRASRLIQPSPPAARNTIESDHAGASARCRDGSLSYSAHHSGTCSHHGGVTEWY